jgi:predicted N-acetyltransferase YhbS
MAAFAYLETSDALLSLVATVHGQVARRIMYSPLTVAENAQGVALGPMAVVLEYQRQELVLN